MFEKCLDFKIPSFSLGLLFIQAEGWKFISREGKTEPLHRPLAFILHSASGTQSTRLLPSSPCQKTQKYEQAKRSEYLNISTPWLSPQMAHLLLEVQCAIH